MENSLVTLAQSLCSMFSRCVWLQTLEDDSDRRSRDLHVTPGCVARVLFSDIFTFHPRTSERIFSIRQLIGPQMEGKDLDAVSEPHSDEFKWSTFDLSPSTRCWPVRLRSPDVVIGFGQCEIIAISANHRSFFPASLSDHSMRKFRKFAMFFFNQKSVQCVRSSS